MQSILSVGNSKTRRVYRRFKDYLAYFTLPPLLARRLGSSLTRRFPYFHLLTFRVVPLARRRGALEIGSMKITFVCDSCRSELTVASRLAGRVVLCPRCRQKTSIPTQSVAAASAVSSESASAGASETSRSPSFVKPCADFVPNPFAFSVRLETFAPANAGDDAFGETPEAALSKTPSVHELIATLLDEDER